MTEGNADPTFDLPYQSSMLDFPTATPRNSLSPPNDIKIADATLDPPQAFDVDALAKSTIKSLELLAPWCQPSNTSKLGFAKDIVQQAYKYAGAIDLSVVAAQKAFTVAEEAISLGELIPFSTPDEHQSYLVDMLELARAGCDTATKTHETFRLVRTDVDDLLKKVKVQPEREGMLLKFCIYLDGRWITNKKTFGVLRSELQAGIKDLEEFTQYINDFATWWNWMKMESTTQYTRTEKIRFNYDSLREKAVIAKWKQLQQQFVSYNDQISRIQEGYPALFVQSRGARQQEELRERQEQKQCKRQEREQRERTGVKGGNIVSRFVRRVGESFGKG